MQRIAIIDIGSNSARLVISHIYKSGAYNMVYNQKEALRLSQKVDDTNMLTEEAFASTIDTMRSFAHMCKVYQADKTIAVATAAIRNASNGAELVAKVAEETGIQLHIISGKTEAYISYLGVINTLDVKNGIIFDLGGLSGPSSRPSCASGHRASQGLFPYRFVQGGFRRGRRRWQRLSAGRLGRCCPWPRSRLRVPLGYLMFSCVVWIVPAGRDRCPPLPAR